MERALNSRGAAHFPAVASQETGFFETFASALKATMSDLAKRYRIASELTSAQSIDEWAEQTMFFTFGVLRFDDGSDYVFAEPSQPPAAAAEPKVVRVRTPSKKRKDLPASPAWTTGARADTPGRGSPPSLQTLRTTRPSEPPEPSGRHEPRGGPRRHSDRDGRSRHGLGHPLGRQRGFQDAFSTQAMVDSYAEAAVGLADHISELREAKDSLARRGADFSIVSDTVRLS